MRASRYPGRIQRWSRGGFRVYGPAAELSSRHASNLAGHARPSSSKATTASFCRREPSTAGGGAVGGAHGGGYFVTTRFRAGGARTRLSGILAGCLANGDHTTEPAGGDSAAPAHGRKRSETASGRP